MIQTGRHTIFGRIAKLSSTGAPVRTTLQAEIARFVRIVVVFALSFGLIVTVLWAAWLNKQHYGFITSSGAVTNLVAVCVAFIPEGMPSAVTISLSVVASRLAKNKILCKTLMTVETLGAADILCADKTGTLTKNQMTVASAAILNEEMSPQEAGDRIGRGGNEGQGCKELAAVAGICNAAVFDDSTSDQPIESRLIDGDATGELSLPLRSGIELIYRFCHPALGRVATSSSRLPGRVERSLQYRFQLKDQVHAQSK